MKLYFNSKRLFFLSVTIIYNSENVAFIFKSCAIYLYLRFKMLFSRLLFFIRDCNTLGGNLIR